MIWFFIKPFLNKQLGKKELLQKIDTSYKLLGKSGNKKLLVSFLIDTNFDVSIEALEFVDSFENPLTK